MNMKTAIYCRVALSDDSMIAKQEESLLRYATENGYSDCVTYRDNGKSGLTLDRHGLSAMMKDVRNNRIQAVIGWRECNSTFQRPVPVSKNEPCIEHLKNSCSFS